MKFIASAVTLLLCPGLSFAAGSKGQGKVSASFTVGQADIEAGTYIFDRDVQVTPSSVVVEDGSVEVNETSVGIPFFEGEPIQVEEGPDGQVTLIPMLNEDERGEVPTKLIVSPEQFFAADLRPQGSRAGNGGLLKFLDPRIPMSERRKHPPIGHCVGYVLSHLGVQVHGNGKDITSALEGIGFHEVSCSRHEVGDVASWTGGWHHLGHTAIWNGQCWAYDKGCGNPGHLYHLINCVHR